MKLVDNFSMKTKLILLYVICVLIPMIFTNWVIIGLISTNLYEQQLKDIDSSYDKVYMQVEEGITGCIMLMNIVSSDSNTRFKEAIHTEYEDMHDYFETFNNYLRDYFTVYNFAFPQMSQISVYVENDSLINGGNFFRVDDQIRKAYWYQYAVGNDPKLVYIINDVNDGKKSLSLVKNNTYMVDGKRYGYIIKIELVKDFFNSILMREFKDTLIYIKDAHGTVVFSNDTHDMNETGFLTFNKSDEKKKGMRIEKKLDGIISETEWNVHILAPKRNLLINQDMKTVKFGVALVFVNLLLPSMMIWIISKSLNFRLRIITKYLKKVHNQKFETIDHLPTKDEIGQLMEAFNAMVKKIKQLINDVYEVNIQKKNIELQKRQAEINALQSQINPHFLFNCLGSIKMRSLIKGENETAQVINNLANLFRISLSWERDMITVKEEIAFVRDYLEIEKYRLGDDLRYSIFVDRQAEACKLPKMSLTTFAENACIHGIENTEGYGFVSVEVLYFGEFIECIISDNGIGMNPEQILDITKYLENGADMKKNVGMKNVIMRLNLYFGDKLEYKIFSNPNQGVKIWLKIPVV